MIPKMLQGSLPFQYTLDNKGRLHRLNMLQVVKEDKCLIIHFDGYIYRTHRAHFKTILLIKIFNAIIKFKSILQRGHPNSELWNQRSQ